MHKSHINYPQIWLSEKCQMGPRTCITVDKWHKTVDKLCELGRTRIFVLFLILSAPPYIGGAQRCLPDIFLPCGIAFAASLLLCKLLFLRSSHACPVDSFLRQQRCIYGTLLARPHHYGFISPKLLLSTYPQSLLRLLVN